MRFKFTKGEPSILICGDVRITEEKYLRMTVPEQESVNKAALCGFIGFYCCVCTAFLSWCPYCCCCAQRMEELSKRYEVMSSTPLRRNAKGVLEIVPSMNEAAPVVTIVGELPASPTSEKQRLK
eukprot:PhF_6_TR8946/c0_g1_i1/m.14096